MREGQIRSGCIARARIFWKKRRPKEGTYESEGADAGVGARGERHGGGGGGGAGQRNLSRRGVWEEWRRRAGEGWRRLQRGGEEGEEVGWALWAVLEMRVQTGKLLNL